MICILRAPGSCFVNETGAPVLSLNSPLVIRQNAWGVRCYWSGEHQTPGSGYFRLWRVTRVPAASIILLLCKCYAFRSTWLFFGGCYLQWNIYMCQMLMGKTSGVLVGRWYSRRAVCVAFTIWPLWWPGMVAKEPNDGWLYIQQESKGVCTPAVGAGQNTVPGHREGSHAESGDAAWAPLAVSNVDLWSGTYTILNCCLYVLSASRYLCAKTWLTLLWKACLITILMIDYSWVWVLQWVLWAGRLTWFWWLSRPIPIWPRLSELITR